MALIGQFVYLAIILLLGVVVLLLRRRAEGTKSGYKITLILLGLLLGLLTISGEKVFSFETGFLKAISVLLLVTLLFELSVRLNPENMRLSRTNLWVFFLIIFANILVISIASALLLNIPVLHGIILAIIMSSIEYFMVDQLKEEGDIANPLIIFFAFSLLVFYTFPEGLFENIVSFLKYILTGLGMGVLIGIIVFKSMKDKYIDGAHELGLVATALATYMITEQLGGSGLFAVMILGVFFGNSYVRKTTRLYSFSPFIFKSLEMLVYILIGFTVTLAPTWQLVWKSFALFLIYLVIRFVVISFVFRKFSVENRLLLSMAPKGMLLGVMILVLGVFGTFGDTVLNSMLLILLFSLMLGVILEFLEHRKVVRLDKVYLAIVNMRFGRKKDLPARKRWHRYYR